MGIVALVILSVTAVWTAAIFGGLQPPGTEQVYSRWYPWNAGGRVMSRIHAFQPPARKAVVIDISGMSHLTADNTKMPKRDRSRLYPHLEIKPVTVEQVLSSQPAVVSSAPAPALAMALRTPLQQGQIEEIALTLPTLLKPSAQPIYNLSIGRKVQMAILADRSISRSIQLTLKATSLKEKVTLRGIVIDQEEKDYIGEKAGEVAGPENVDNRLTVL